MAADQDMEVSSEGRPPKNDRRDTRRRALDQRGRNIDQELAPISSQGV